MSSSIGSYTVIRMSAPPVPEAEQVELETRAGTDGVAAWLTGTRGRQCQLETVVDVTSQANAATLISAYLGLIGAGPQTVTFCSQSYGSYLVLDVQTVVEPVTGAVGGISGGVPAALVRATWTLIAV